MRELLFIALVLVCPLMMMFMMRGHGHGHGGSASGQFGGDGEHGAGNAEEARELTADELRRRRAELDNLIAEREAADQHSLADTTVGRR
jgi:hypothetical protein